MRKILRMLMATTFLASGNAVWASNQDDDNENRYVASNNSATTGRSTDPALINTLTVLENTLIVLAHQTGNPELFVRDYSRDFLRLTFPQLQALIVTNALAGALDPQTEAGETYWQIMAELNDTDNTSLSYGSNQLMLCPPLENATHLVELDLSENQMRVLSDEIEKLTNLRSLDIGRNPFVSLSSNIWKLTDLTTLSLSENNLLSIPVDIGQMTNLELLNLRGNRFRELPDVIGNLTRLETLLIDSRYCISLPSTITTLTNLSWLGLSDQQLHSPQVLTLVLGLMTRQSENPRARVRVEGNNIQNTSEEALRERLMLATQQIALPGILHKRTRDDL